MAYCGNCGAYIPDGETKCMACGSIIGQTAGASTASAQAAMPEDEKAKVNFREEYERQQAENKAKSEQWAQQANAQHQSHSTSQNIGGTPTAQRPASSGSGLSGTSKSKIFSVLSYFGILCLLPFFFTPHDDFAKYHGKQGVLLLILSLVIDAISTVSGIAAILQIARIYLVVKGIINAYNGRKEPLPYIGQLAEKF